MQPITVPLITRKSETSSGVCRCENVSTTSEVATAAATAGRNLAARAVRQIVDRFCQGSVEELVSGMVDAKVLSNRELDRLAEMVRRRRGRGA